MSQIEEVIAQGKILRSFQADLKLDSFYQSQFHHNFLEWVRVEVTEWGSKNVCNYVSAKGKYNRTFPAYSSLSVWAPFNLY